VNVSISPLLFFLVEIFCTIFQTMVEGNTPGSSPAHSEQTLNDNDEERHPPAPIPYLNADDDSDIAPAPIPYLKSGIRNLRLSTPADGEDEGADNNGTDDEDANDNDSGGAVGRWRERIIGNDERIQVKPATSQPYKWICHLKIFSGRRRYSGSGFLVNIPGATMGCIFTAGHNLWMDTRAYADRIDITFPGRDTIQISEQSGPAGTVRQHYFVSRQYEQRFDRHHDYGVIVLPGGFIKKDLGTAPSRLMTKYVLLRLWCLDIRETSRQRQCGVLETCF
jgi:hypothetical protein